MVGVTQYNIARAANAAWTRRTKETYRYSLFIHSFVRYSLSLFVRTFTGGNRRTDAAQAQSDAAQIDHDRSAVDGV